MNEIKFHPMSQKPSPDECDASFSTTVIVYSDKYVAVGLGYYDFEIDEWLHSGHDSFLLKCWCYIPIPTIENDKNWEVIRPKGYIKSFF